MTTESSQDGSPRNTSRRRFVTTSISAAAGLLIGAGTGLATSNESGSRDMRVGAVGDRSASTVDLISAKDGRVSRVAVTPDTTFWRDEPATFLDFGVGEEVVAFGLSTDEGFVADHLERLYRAYNGKLQVLSDENLRVSTEAISTTSATLLIDSVDEEAKPSLRDSAGREVHVLAWYRPTRGDVAASRIYLM